MAVRLFVGNLPYDATEADLREHFSAVGALSYVYLPTDRETGKPRGFAFIEYSERAQAEEAIKRFNSQLFKGRPIAVNEARAREDRPRTGGPERSVGSGPGWSSPPPAPGEPPSAGGKPSRSFGPDAAPRRKGKGGGRGMKADRGPKKPIRERGGGQLSWVGDEDSQEEDFSEPGDDMGEDNFASRLPEEDE
jgi:RNA recognition motif-containing protein